MKNYQDQDMPCVKQNHYLIIIWFAPACLGAISSQKGEKEKPSITNGTMTKASVSKQLSSQHRNTKSVATSHSPTDYSVPYVQESCRVPVGLCHHNYGICFLV